MREQIRAASHGDTSKAVYLSTIHGMKGAERPVVYVCGVMDGLLPHWTALGNVKMESGILPFGNSASIIDERRLFFVAVSRAMEEVHLTGPWIYRNKALTKSMFARETGLVSEEVVEQAIREIVGSPADDNEVSDS
jgi:DNA helicase-2/ATP-dependent DNA helicase PcrA